MGQAVDGHRFEPGIAKDDLVERLDRRIAGLRRQDVERELLAQLGQLFQKTNRHGLAQRLEVGLQVRAVARITGIVPQGAADLRRELVVQAVDQIAHVIGHVADVQAFAPPVTRVEDLLEILDGAGDHVVVGQRAMAQVADRGQLSVGLDDAVGQLRELFFAAKIRGHGSCSCTDLLRCAVKGPWWADQENVSYGCKAKEVATNGYTVQEQRQPRTIWFLVVVIKRIPGAR